MQSQEHCFIPFKKTVDLTELPERFTFPFYYQPHTLCVLAAEELQQYLQTQTTWQHNFGLSSNAETAIGKMFGVLLVRNKNGEIGYLAGFSGKIAEKNHLPNFVPPVFDMLNEDSFFIVGQSELTALTVQIKLLEANPKIMELEAALRSVKDKFDKEIKAHRAKW